MSRRTTFGTSMNPGRMSLAPSFPVEEAFTSEQQEKERLMQLLQNLEQEEAYLDQQIVERQQQLSQDMQIVENEIIRQQQMQADLLKSKENDSSEIKELKMYLENISNEMNRTQAFVEGLKALFGVADVKVLDRDGQLQMRVALSSGLSCIITLGADKRVTDIELSSYQSISHQMIRRGILSKCQQLPTPCDLKFAVYALECAQHRNQLLQQHIKELRKLCIVTINNNNSNNNNNINSSTNSNSYVDIDSIVLTLRSGVAITVAMDVTYGAAPNSVDIEQIHAGIGNRRTAEDIEAIRNTLNTLGHSNALDMYQSIATYFK